MNKEYLTYIQYIHKYIFYELFDYDFLNTNDSEKIP